MDLLLHPRRPSQLTDAAPASPDFSLRSAAARSGAVSRLPDGDEAGVVVSGERLLQIDGCEDRRGRRPECRFSGRVLLGDNGLASNGRRADRWVAACRT